MSNLAVSTVAQGLLWAVMALGVYVTFRVLDLADLTCEGSFPLGAATAATLMATGHSVSTAILAAAVAGMLAGAVTGNPYHDCAVFRQSAHHGQSQFILIRRGYGVYVYPEGDGPE